MEDLYWVWLSRIKEIGPITILKLLKTFKTPEKIWKAKKEELLENGINENLALKVLDKSYRKDLDKYLNYMRINKIKIIKICDSTYPEKLKKIYAPPIVLFAKGNIEILNKLGIAIVGCRNCSVYGEKVTRKFAYNLAKHDINIISGMAKGIDTCAHLGCLQAKGKTIAVMGAGLDIIYPSENKNIFNKIVETEGIVLSEYIIGTKPIPENFPRRNRIISGLSDGVLVVEAKEKSGTLITVDFALEQGKEIFVIPGNIDSENSLRNKRAHKTGSKISYK